MTAYSVTPHNGWGAVPITFDPSGLPPGPYPGDLTPLHLLPAVPRLTPRSVPGKHYAVEHTPGVGYVGELRRLSGGRALLLVGGLFPFVVPAETRP
jgi:hypothetical protein